MSVLQLEGIRRSYGYKHAVRGVDFSANPGEVIGLLGRNGAGKTTLLRVAVGILYPDAGKVSLFGIDPWRDPVRAKLRLGYVGEVHPVPPGITVRALLDFHRSVFPTWDPEYEAKLLSKLEVPEGSRIDQLSRGQARKAILITAIAHRPELLIMDEPAGGLDPAARREFLEVAIELLSNEGTAILFSSHHVGDVERIAERVAVIDDGRILLDAPLERLKQDYTLAVLPASAEQSLAQLNGASGLVRARRRGGSVYAVFSQQPEQVEEVLRTMGHTQGAYCSRTSLEELFVAMMGGRS